MPKNCSLEVYNALKDSIGKDEADSIVEEVNNRAMKRVREKEETLSSALENVHNEMALEEERIANISKRNSLKNIIIKKEINERIKGFNSPIDGINSLLDGVSSNAHNSRLSASSYGFAKKGEYLSSFTHKLDSDGLWETWHDKSISEELANQLANSSKSNNENIVKLASHISDLFEGLRKEQNALGADIGKSDGYTGKTSHNKLKMLSTSNNLWERLKLRAKLKNDSIAIREFAFNKWKNFITDLIDWDKIKNYKSKDEFLRSFYDATSSGIRKANKEDGSAAAANLGIKPKSSLAARISHRKVVHFKDGSSWLKYNNEYGNGDMRSSILSHFGESSMNIGLMKLWGPNPDAMFDHVIQKTLEKNRTNADIVNKVGSLTDIYREMTGKNSIPVNVRLAEIAKTMRRFQSITKLGGILPSSLPDIATHGRALRQNGMGFFDSYANAFNSILKGRPSGEQKQISELIGIGSDHLLGETVARHSAEDSSHGTFSKLEQAMFRLNGLNWWDSVHRNGGAIMLSRWLGMHSEMFFNELPEKLQRSLGQYGIDHQEWDIIKNSITTLKDGKKYITPDKLPLLTTEEIGEILNKAIGEVTEKDIERITKDTEEKLRSYFQDQTDHIVLNPRASDRSAILRGTQAGTPFGEAARFIAQFKMFSVSFYRRILTREVTGDQSWKSSSQGLVELAVGATSLGYLSVAAHDVLNGKKPSDPSSYDTWIRSIARGGGLGIMGDLIFGDFSTYGQGAAESMSGPVFSQAFQMLNTISKARDLKDPRSSLFYLAKSNIPFANLPYTKIAINYMFMWGINERLSPGYLHRMTKKAYDKNNDFLVNPEQYANRF